MRRTIAAYVAILMLLTPLALARQRAVAHPTTPTLRSILPNVTGAVRVTNQGSASASTTVCAESLCKSALLPVGSTTTFPAGTWPVGAALTVMSDQALEARADSDAIPITAARTITMALPITSTGETFFAYALAPGSIDVGLLPTDGVREALTTLPLHAGINDLTTGFTLTIGKQLELQPTVPVIAYALSNGSILRATALADATGDQFLVRATPDTIIFLRNPVSYALLTISGNLLPPNQDNTNTGNFTYTTALNYGSTALRDFAYGSVHLEGLRTSNGQEPFLAWAEHHTIQAREEGATARTGQHETLQKYNLSLNTLGPTLTLLNASRFFGTITGTITGLDDNGTITGTLSYELRTSENQDIDLTSLHATRLIVSANDNPIEGDGTLPTVLASTIVNGEAFPGYQLPKPAGATGEQYVAHWLDPLQHQYFYLDNRMTRCLWQATCGTADFGTALATLLAQSSTSPTHDPAQLLQSFKDVTDGNPANDEIYAGFSPMTIDLRGNGTVRLYLAPTGTSIVDWQLTPPSTTSVYAVIRSFLAAYMTANPSACGGTTACDLTNDPGFTNQNKPQTSGEPYVAHWLDPLHQQDFFLSNREVQCMLRGDCGAPSLIPDLATIFAHSPGETWTDDQFRTWLTQAVDGVTSDTNLELWEHEDPFVWTAGVGLSFTVTRSQTTWTREPGTLILTPADTEHVYQLLRSFLVQLVTTHPDWYAGTPVTGPSIAFNPTWSTRDPN